MAIINANEKTFESEVLNSDLPTLVDFNADWCGPCQMLHPILKELADSDAYKIVSVDVDANPTLAEQYSVSSIPCLVLFQDGTEVNRKIGLQSKSKLEKLLGAA